MDFYRCLIKTYPNATPDIDFTISDSGNGLYLSFWNESKLGLIPNLDISTFHDIWLELSKEDKINEIKIRTFDEIENGLSGYTTQSFQTNFKISSSRSDLINMQNLLEFCRQAIVRCIDVKYEPEISIIVTNEDNSWRGELMSASVLSKDEDGDISGLGYFTKCRGKLINNSLLYVDVDGTKVPVATCANIVKENLDNITFRDFNNNFHLISTNELEIIIGELQAYGLWLFQHKWEKEQEVFSCSTVEEVENVEW